MFFRTFKFFVSAVFFLTTTAYATPSINNTTGSLIGNQSITITGSSFGSGPNVELFELFENGTTGNVIALDGPRVGAWTAHGGQSIIYDDAAAHSGDHSGRVFWWENPGMRQVRLTFSEACTEIFISYWVKLPTSIFPNTSIPRTFPEPSSWKFTFLMDGIKGYLGNDDLCTPTMYGGGGFMLAGNDYTPNFHMPHESFWSWGEWIRISFWLKADPVNPSTANGTMAVQTISKKLGMWTKIETGKTVFNPDNNDRDDSIFQWTNINIPGWIRNTWGEDHVGTHVVQDDIYIAIGANAQARVEIGDNATYSACTNLAIQSSTAWSATSITITANQGAFKAGDSVYLFVVDAEGNASNGYGPVIIGGQPTDDNQPPITSGHSPAKNATGIAADSNIVAHVQDVGDGVDQSTIVMKVNGKTVSPIIEGDSSNYTLTYDPPLDFNAGAAVNVTIEASDLHTPPNVMPADSYSFTIASAPPVDGAITKTFGETPDDDYKNTVQDTFINLNTDINLESQTLNTYTWQTNQPANAIIMKWDLSSIPEGAQIESANLYLYMTASGGDTEYDISVHNIINHNPDLTKSTGFTYDGTNEWTSNNKCYNNIPLAQADIGDAEDIRPINKTIGYKTWNVTNMIRDWTNYPNTNYGLLINSDALAGSNSHRYFASSEALDENQRPKLIVSYSINPDTIPPRDVTSVNHSLIGNQLTFTWSNPKSAENTTLIPENQDFAGVMIRYNAGKDVLPPATHSEGTLFCDKPGNLDSNDSCTNNIGLGQDYKFSLFTYDSSGNYSQTVHITVDASSPGSVGNFTASSGDKQIILSWTNPSDQDYAGTVIRYGTKAYPSDSKHGSLAIDKKGTLSGDDSFVHGGLQNDLTYYYSAFAYDPSGNYSEAVNLSATPRVPPDTTPPSPPTGTTAK